MSLSLYHQKYASHSDEEIRKRADEKRNELSLIFDQVRFDPNNDVLRIAVLGCGDKRFVKLHKEIISEFFNKQIEVITFDITTNHLFGEENVIKHDCTLPLPNTPFDITYGHVLLKFIETEKQWDVIRNSYDALREGGIAIHVMDKEDYETKDILLPNGQFSVPLGRWKEKLNQMNIRYKEISVRFGLAFVISKT